MIEKTPSRRIGGRTQAGWQVVDEPGKPMLIHKDALLVDPAYQRSVKDDDAKVIRVAAQWSWVACGCISVGHRNGDFYVIDGQHRVLAALLRPEISHLPCMVFETKDQKEEASGFLKVNRNRKPMTMIQAFRAQITSGNPVAKVAERILSQAGLRVSPGSEPNDFNAIGALMKCLELDEAAMVRIWPVLVDVCRGHHVHNRLLRAAFYLERSLVEGQSLADPHWRKKMLSVGYSELIASMNKAAAYHNATGEKVWAEGMLKALNYKSRSNLLEMRQKFH